MQALNESLSKTLEALKTGDVAQLQNMNADLEGQNRQLLSEVDRNKKGYEALLKKQTSLSTQTISLTKKIKEAKESIDRN